MELYDFYPLPEDLIQNELTVLDYLATSTYLAEEHPEFFSDANKYRAQYRGPRRGFQFASYFNVYHKELPRLKKRTASSFREEPNVQLIVAGLVEQETKSKYGNISYLFAVGKIRSVAMSAKDQNSTDGQRTHPSLMRKFHFDVTKNAGRQEHPMCHLQYCGKMIPLMTQLGFRGSQLQQMFEKLSEPRIFFWPMSLSLLVDMALHEFPDEKSTRFRNEPEWKNLIRKSEDFLLGPFYEKCVAIIRSAKKQRNTLADEFYVTRKT